MRVLLSSWFVLIVTGVADAHTLASDEGISLQIGHQFFGLHHLQITAVLLLGCVVLIRHIHRTGQRDKKGQQ